MADIQYNRFYKYEDLTRILTGLAAEYPQLVHLESIGESHEGRDVWVLTVTNFATGGDREK
ncbi:MAG: M14 family zinc carboxypeptidase, partial [Anaerolineae bacterium]